MRYLPSIVALSLLLLAILARAEVPHVPPLTDPVRLHEGLVSGELRNGIRSYKGIPFAAPPVGALRWKPPQPATPWEGVRACTAYGPWCPQPTPLMGKVTGRQSEDCLYLNLWTPAKTAADKFPVMVWIHGGGFTTGSGNAPYYDGTALAQQGVVLVTVNYRLGPFGFFAHPLLSKESEHGVSGNYGLLDQIAALHWVRRNIAAFGGDPECVTIFGESAGAASVCRLLVSPLAAGLFHRAIAQSGAAAGRDRHLRVARQGTEGMEALGERLAQKLGCGTAADPLAALRAKSADEILAAADAAQGLFGKGNKFGPVIDGWVLPDDPEVLLAAGKFHRVPVLCGTNADEGTVFLRQLPALRVRGYRLLVQSLCKDEAATALRLFPAAADDAVPAAMNKLVTVAAFTANCRRFARQLSAHGHPVYVYHFTRVPPAQRNSGLGAFHGLEVSYVFQTLVPPDRELATAMSACWVRFAATGDPNGANLPRWPRYDAQTDQHLVFGDTVTVSNGLYKAECDFCDRWHDRRVGELFALD